MAENRNEMKIKTLAQDLGMRSKELCDLLVKYGYTDKTVNGSVTEEEFNVVMGAMTASNQIVNINDYVSGKTHIIVETEERIQKREEEARLAAEKAAAEEAAKKLAEEEKAMANTRLLEEIRDLLKNK